MEKYLRFLIPCKIRKSNRQHLQGQGEKANAEVCEELVILRGTCDLVSSSFLGQYDGLQWRRQECVTWEWPSTQAIPEREVKVGGKYLGLEMKWRNTRSGEEDKHKKKEKK